MSDEYTKAQRAWTAYTSLDTKAKAHLKSETWAILFRACEDAGGNHDVFDKIITAVDGLLMEDEE